MQALHSDMVRTLVKNPVDLLAELNPLKVNLIHASMGISGEAGELLDAIKKHAIYDKELDVENVIEELGDIEFYLEQLRQQLGISRDMTLNHNYEKLKTRYEGFKYSNEAAHNRIDKA